MSRAYEMSVTIAGYDLARIEKSRPRPEKSGRFRTGATAAKI